MASSAITTKMRMDSLGFNSDHFGCLDFYRGGPRGDILLVRM